MPDTRVLKISGPSGFLGLRERLGASLEGTLPPVLLLHGATLGSALFDLPCPGYSLMEELARPGRAVYALDISGYGLSGGGAVMDAPPEANPPFAGTTIALRDIAVAVAFILARRAVPALDLIGFSWGTVAAARYAGDHPAEIRRLALYAPLYAEHNPLWLGRIAEAGNGQGLGAYRLVTASGLVERWDSDLPIGDPSEFREDGIAGVVFDEVAALDPDAASRWPRAFRCPNGAFADMLEIFSGQPLYDPAKLTMPLLAVRGSDDTTSTATDTDRLLALAASRDKRVVAIERGSHFLCLEKNRASLYRELDRFLAADQLAGQG